MCHTRNLSCHTLPGLSWPLSQPLCQPGAAGTLWLLLSTGLGLLSIPPSIPLSICLPAGGDPAAAGGELLLLGSSAPCFRDALPQDAFPMGSSHSDTAHVPWPWLPALRCPLSRWHPGVSVLRRGCSGPGAMPWRCCESLRAQCSESGPCGAPRARAWMCMGVGGQCCPASGGPQG